MYESAGHAEMIRRTPCSQNRAVRVRAGVLDTGVPAPRRACLARSTGLIIESEVYQGEAVENHVCWDVYE